MRGCKANTDLDFPRSLTSQHGRVAWLRPSPTRCAHHGDALRIAVGEEEIFEDPEFASSLVLTPQPPHHNAEMKINSEINALEIHHFEQLSNTISYKYNKYNKYRYKRCNQPGADPKSPHFDPPLRQTIQIPNQIQ